MNIEHISILLIEDEAFDVRRVENTIRFFRDNITIEKVVSNGNAALEALEEENAAFDVVIMDYQIAGKLRGEELIRHIKNIDPALQIIVITKLTINITDFTFANDLMEAGAFWYCTKYPGDIEDYIYQPTDFSMSIVNAAQKRRLEKEKDQSDSKLVKKVEDVIDRKQIISVSESMARLKNDFELLAQNDFSILITGASGTGKELIANNIHYRSKRKFDNFVPINCGSIPHDLIESELFGYEKGAFTGANKAKKGLFELADKGTLFLDEVAELPLSAQVKLLRVIQEGEIEKIGRTQSIRVDVRIIAATNKNLEEEVKARRFREDLYYRLNVMPLSIPPLKDRPEDIEILIDHFLTKYSFEIRKSKPTIDSDALKALMQYEWYGNVRELKNIVQRLLFHCKSNITIEAVEQALMRRIVPNDSGDSASLDLSGMQEIKPLKEFEFETRRIYVEYVRKQSKSDSDAARKLGLAPSNFYRMCKELGLK